MGFFFTRKAASRSTKPKANASTKPKAKAKPKPRAPPKAKTTTTANAQGKAKSATMTASQPGVDTSASACAPARRKPTFDYQTRSYDFVTTMPRKNQLLWQLGWFLNNPAAVTVADMGARVLQSENRPAMTFHKSAMANLVRKAQAAALCSFLGGVNSPVYKWFNNIKIDMTTNAMRAEAMQLLCTIGRWDPSMPEDATYMDWACQAAVLRLEDLDLDLMQAPPLLSANTRRVVNSGWKEAAKKSGKAPGGQVGANKAKFRTVRARRAKKEDTVDEEDDEYVPSQQTRVAAKRQPARTTRPMIKREQSSDGSFHADDSDNRQSPSPSVDLWAPATHDDDEYAPIDNEADMTAALARLVHEHDSDAARAVQPAQPGPAAHPAWGEFASEPHFCSSCDMPPAWPGPLHADAVRDTLRDNLRDTPGDHGYSFSEASHRRLYEHSPAAVTAETAETVSGVSSRAASMGRNDTAATSVESHAVKGDLPVDDAWAETERFLSDGSWHKSPSPEWKSFDEEWPDPDVSHESYDQTLDHAWCDGASPGRSTYSDLVCAGEDYIFSQAADGLENCNLSQTPAMPFPHLTLPLVPEHVQIKMEGLDYDMGQSGLQHDADDFAQSDAEFVDEPMDKPLADHVLVKMEGMASDADNDYDQEFDEFDEYQSDDHDSVDMHMKMEHFGSVDDDSAGSPAHEACLDAGEAVCEFGGFATACDRVEHDLAEMPKMQPEPFAPEFVGAAHELALPRAKYADAAAGFGFADLAADYRQLQAQHAQMLAYGQAYTAPAYGFQGGFQGGFQRSLQHSPAFFSPPYDPWQARMPMAPMAYPGWPQPGFLAHHTVPMMPSLPNMHNTSSMPNISSMSSMLMSMPPDQAYGCPHNVHNLF